MPSSDPHGAEDVEPLAVAAASAEAEPTPTTTDPAVAESNKQTAEAAKRWLVEAKAHRGFRALRPRERVRIVQAYAARNKVVYAKHLT